jgi:Bifunctional DNA primase/polymerase, N-terminal.
VTLNLAALSQAADAEETPEETLFEGEPHPVHWNPEGVWQHRPLYRKTDDYPRRPAIARPENLSKDATQGDRDYAEKYWNQSGSITWAELHDAVTNGFRFRRQQKPQPCDVALFPASSGLVVVDCDVKRYDAKTGFVVTGGAASLETLVPERVEYGLADLQREVEKMGHTMLELATYTVQTKSGGHHFYFRENPRVKLVNSGHRHEWRVDVVAHNAGSDRSWVAAPPTPGYEVVRDFPVTEMPDWLAGWLRDVNHKLPALGQERRKAMNLAAGETRRRVLALPTGEADGNLMRVWVQGELDVVAESNRVGGWNLAIYQCTLNLLEGGWDKDVVELAVLKAAAPVSNLESRNAAYTIESAYRRHLYKVAEGEA